MSTCKPYTFPYYWRRNDFHTTCSLHLMTLFVGRNKPLFENWILSRMRPDFCGPTLFAINQVSPYASCATASSCIRPRWPLNLLTRASHSSLLPTAPHIWNPSLGQRTTCFRTSFLLQKKQRRLSLPSNHRTNQAQTVSPCPFFPQTQYNTTIPKPVCYPHFNRGSSRSVEGLQYYSSSQNGSSYDPKNYRPVNRKNILSRLTERIIKNQLTGIFTTEKQSNESQYIFE